MQFGMEDEATDDPDGCVWEKDDDAQMEEEPELACAGDSDGESFDPRDWVDPESAKAKYLPTPTTTTDHCNGDSTPAKRDNSQDVMWHQAKMRAYTDAHQIIASINDPNAASLAATAKAVMGNEEKRFYDMQKSNPAIRNQMREFVLEEKAKYKRLREELAPHMTGEKERQASNKKLKDAKSKLQKTQAELDSKNAVVTALNQAKAYTPQMLGEGRKHGGTKEHQRNRRDVLDRVRHTGFLSPEQEGQYEYFAEAWDNEMKLVHDKSWGSYFAEILTNVLNQMLEGDPNAFGTFMRNETKRVLCNVCAMVAPGMDMLTD